MRIMKPFITRDAINGWQQKCDQSLEAIPEVVPLEEGFQFIAICPHHCVLSPEGRVFGTSTFAPESAVCISGMFAGVCSPAVEAACNLLVTVGGGKSKFTKDTAHDIESLEHGPSDASYTLAKAPCEALEDERPSYFFTFGSPSAPEVRIIFERLLLFFNSAQYLQGWLVDDGSPRRMKNGIEYGALV